MKRILIPLLALGLLAVPALAQDPIADYNRARAYSHYQNSPYPFRTYSDLIPGRSWGYDTPWQSGRFTQTPGYYREETSPFGRFSTVLPSEVRGLIVPRVPDYVPGSAYGYPYPRYSDPYTPYRSNYLRSVNPNVYPYR
jgi:hypothetical protein